MKILKPGKVEQREFVCHKCGCTFVAENTEANVWGYVTCPQEKCLTLIHWQNSEPYEEPTQSDKERLLKLLREWRRSRSEEFPVSCANYLIANGVAFKEDTNAKN